MPVSGRPANSALLKITQGSSGVATKSFHRKATAGGGVVWSAWAKRRLLARFRDIVTTVASSPAEMIERARTAISQAFGRGAGEGRAGVARSRSGPTERAYSVPDS